MPKLRYILLLFCITKCFTSMAQLSSIDDKFGKAIAQKRYEINTKRIGVPNNGEEALAAAREYKRIEPNYYVGYLLEGSYLYNNANDIIGYKNAAQPLIIAKQLIEKDYKTELKNRSAELLEFYKTYYYHKDYDYICYCLYNALSYADDEEQAWKTLRSFQKINIPDESYMDSYNMLAWMVHRNRFYTNEKYSFLKKSILENEKYASKLLDSSLIKAKKDEPLMTNFFSDFYNYKALGVYHYKSILHCYNLKIDSANYYYNKLKNTPAFPANNYATFCAIQGKFKEAEENYKIAAQNESSDKRLKEHVYYTAMINMYKGENKTALQNILNQIKESGFTPGYGWYNLALARNLLYDGQYANANYYLQKAQEFKELHLGTTLGQTHYDFTTNLLKLVSKEHSIAAQKFENKNWWWQVKQIGKRLGLLFNRFKEQYIIINQFSNNPERDNVVYKLFSSESTVSYDEVWFLIKDYSTMFFIKKYENQLQDEKRPLVKKYYKLFLAKLYIKENQYPTADSILTTINDKDKIDLEYEKLLHYRVLEAQVKCATKLKKSKSIITNLVNKMYDTYPSLLPYSSYPIEINVNISGNIGENFITQLTNKLKAANVIISANNANAPLAANIIISKEKDVNTISFTVKNKNGDTKIPVQKFSYLSLEDAAKNTLYGLFNIGNINKNLNIGAIKNKDVALNY
jgi:hypothetical protein